MTSSDFQAYVQRRERLIAELAAPRANGASIGLAKSTSNLFRHRLQTGTKRIDVRCFHHVLDIAPSSRIADVEGMTTYEELADETLKHRLLPTVVPQLKTITIGGAVSGIGIESSSFKYGLVHETIEEMEIVLGDGSTIACSATQNPDLFYGFPNSYGTLGYVLRLKVKLIPAKNMSSSRIPGSPSRRSSSRRSSTYARLRASTTLTEWSSTAARCTSPPASSPTTRRSSA